MRKFIIILLLVCFVTLTNHMPALHAGEVFIPAMPKPGSMVNLSPAFVPAHLKGLVIDPNNALQFDFLIDQGQGNLSQAQKKLEYNTLIKYFLAALTVPDGDQWVNLSPFENKRIIADDFGKTEMGRDLLAQDYLLKQITSSLMYPESGLGKSFWDKVYQETFKRFGNTTIPVNTFNKVWIIPDQATIHESRNTAFIVQSHLKVMLEEDYLANQRSNVPASQVESRTRSLSSQVIREIILPELEREVNEGKNFAQLRQVFSGMILATWFKKSLKESLLGKVYANQGKINGVNQQDPGTNAVIYGRYLQAFKKGVFNYVKDDIDPYTQKNAPRKYFAGGISNQAMAVLRVIPVKADQMRGDLNALGTAVDAARVRLDSAMAVDVPSDFKQMENTAQKEYLSTILAKNTFSSQDEETVTAIRAYLAQRLEKAYAQFSAIDETHKDHQGEIDVDFEFDALLFDVAYIESMVYMIDVSKHSQLSQYMKWGIRRLFDYINQESQKDLTAEQVKDLRMLRDFMAGLERDLDRNAYSSVWNGAIAMLLLENRAVFSARGIKPAAATSLELTEILRDVLRGKKTHAHPRDVEVAKAVVDHGRAGLIGALILRLNELDSKDIAGLTGTEVIAWLKSIPVDGASQRKLWDKGLFTVQEFKAMDGLNRIGILQIILTQNNLTPVEQEFIANLRQSYLEDLNAANARLHRLFTPGEVIEPQQIRVLIGDIGFCYSILSQIDTAPASGINEVLKVQIRDLEGLWKKYHDQQHSFPGSVLEEDDLQLLRDINEELGILLVMDSHATKDFQAVWTVWSDLARTLLEQQGQRMDRSDHAMSAVRQERRRLDVDGLLRRLIINRQRFLNAPMSVKVILQAQFNNYLDVFNRQAKASNTRAQAQRGLLLKPTVWLTDDQGNSRTFSSTETMILDLRVLSVLYKEMLDNRLRFIKLTIDSSEAQEKKRALQETFNDLYMDYMHYSMRHGLEFLHEQTFEVLAREQLHQGGELSILSLFVEDPEFLTYGNQAMVSHFKVAQVALQQIFDGNPILLAQIGKIQGMAQLTAFVQGLIPDAQQVQADPSDKMLYTRLKDFLAFIERGDTNELIDGTMVPGVIPFEVLTDMVYSRQDIDKVVALVNLMLEGKPIEIEDQSSKAGQWLEKTLKKLSSFESETAILKLLSSLKGKELRHSVFKPDLDGIVRLKISTSSEDVFMFGLLFYRNFTATHDIHAYFNGKMYGVKLNDAGEVTLIQFNIDRSIKDVNSGVNDAAMSDATLRFKGSSEPIVIKPEVPKSLQDLVQGLGRISKEQQVALLNYFDRQKISSLEEWMLRLILKNEDMRAYVEAVRERLFELRFNSTEVEAFMDRVRFVNVPQEVLEVNEGRFTAIAMINGQRRIILPYRINRNVAQDLTNGNLLKMLLMSMSETPSVADGLSPMVQEHTLARVGPLEDAVRMGVEMKQQLSTQAASEFKFSAWNLVEVSLVIAVWIKMVKIFWSSDKSMSAENPGGIIMDGGNLNMAIKRDGNGVPLPIVQQDALQLVRLNGFVPHILEIRQALSLPQFQNASP